MVIEHVKQGDIKMGEVTFPFLLLFTFSGHHEQEQLPDLKYRLFYSRLIESWAITYMFFLQHIPGIFKMFIVTAPTVMGPLGNTCVFV